VLHFGLALILAGALGNLYDRIMYGAVRDMLYLFPGVKLPFGITWPGGNPELYPWIFNIADAALCVGVVLIILTMLRKPRT
jgi:signal peptidase II